MARKPLSLSDQVRHAIEHAGISRYALARRIGCSQALLSRFMGRTGGLSLRVLDRIGEQLGLKVVSVLLIYAVVYILKVADIL